MRGELTETDAQRLHALGPEAVTLFALAMAYRVTELETAGAKASTPDPATPSGQVPVYTKPAAYKRRKRPGARWCGFPMST